MRKLNPRLRKWLTEAYKWWSQNRNPASRFQGLRSYSAPYTSALAVRAPGPRLARVVTHGEVLAKCFTYLGLPPLCNQNASFTYGLQPPPQMLYKEHELLFGFISRLTRKCSRRKLQQNNFVNMSRMMNYSRAPSQGVFAPYLLNLWNPHPWLWLPHSWSCMSI